MAVSDGRIIQGSDVKSLLGETGSDNDTIITLSIRRAEGAIRRYLRYDPVLASRTEFYPQTDSRVGGGNLIIEATATHAVFTTPESTRGTELQVQHLPIRGNPAVQLFVDYNAKAGTSVGSFPSDTEKVEGVDFWANYDSLDSDGYRVCRDGILRSHGLWPTEPGSVKLIYTAGYSALELQGQDATIDASPIWDTALEECVQRCKRALVNKKSSTLGYIAGPLLSEELGDYSYRVSDSIAQSLFGVKTYDLLPESMDRMESFVNYGIDLFS